MLGKKVTPMLAKDAIFGCHGSDRAPMAVATWLCRSAAEKALGKNIDVTPLERLEATLEHQPPGRLLGDVLPESSCVFFRTRVCSDAASREERVLAEISETIPDGCELPAALVFCPDVLAYLDATGIALSRGSRPVLTPERLATAVVRRQGGWLELVSRRTAEEAAELRVRAEQLGWRTIAPPPPHRVTCTTVCLACAGHRAMTPYAQAFALVWRLVEALSRRVEGDIGMIAPACPDVARYSAKALGRVNRAVPGMQHAFYMLTAPPSHPPALCSVWVVLDTEVTGSWYPRVVHVTRRREVGLPCVCSLVSSVIFPDSGS